MFEWVAIMLGFFYSLYWLVLSQSHKNSEEEILKTTQAFITHKAPEKKKYRNIIIECLDAGD